MAKKDILERGSSFVAIRKFVQGRFGREGEKELLSRISAPINDTYMNATPHGWYPVSHTKALLEVVFAMSGEDENAILEIGAIQTREDVKGILRFLVLFATPDQLIKRSTKLWSQHVDQGTVTYEKLESRSCEIVLSGFYNGKLNCLMATGAVRELTSFSGGKSVEVKEVECAGEGASACRWKISWT
ncbi:hypothetical protein GX441_12005 [bacterium]|nr:hypothetical protein [bacterium]